MPHITSADRARSSRLRSDLHLRHAMRQPQVLEASPQHLADLHRQIQPMQLVEPPVFRGAMRPKPDVIVKPSGPQRIPTRSRRSPSWITWACVALSIGAVVAIVFGAR